MHFCEISLVVLSATINTLAQNQPVVPPGDDRTGTQPQGLNNQLGAGSRQPGSANDLSATNNNNNGGRFGSGGFGSGGTGAGTRPGTGIGGGGRLAGGGGAGGGPQVPFEFGSPAQVLQQAQYVEGQFDCQGQKYDRGMQCNDQGNTGPENAVFIIAPGGTLSNCVIGPNQIEGIHCEGDCVLENIWVEDVCEDAFTFRQQQGTSYVIGGGAFNAVDKIMNHNGGGTVVIRNFYAEQFGKICRSCSDCENMSDRYIVLENVWAVNGLELVGLNANSGDQAMIVGSCAQSVDRVCSSYEGGGSSGGVGMGGGGAGFGGAGDRGFGGSGAGGGIGSGTGGGGGGFQGGTLGNGRTSNAGLREVSQNSGGGVGGGPNNQALRGNNAGQPAQLAEGDEQSRSSGTGGGGGSGSGSRFDGTGIDGDGSSFNDPARLSEGPTQQCQYTQADIQNCPPF